MKVQYPLVSDRNQQISRTYGVLDKDAGAPYRATFIIDPEGIVVSKLIYPREVGRNAYEILRILEALQFSNNTGLGAPANWEPGDPGIQRNFYYVGKI